MLVGAVLSVVGVLVVRMAPRALVSLWPAIITEMVQVFLVMEQQLAQDTPMFRLASSTHDTMPTLSYSQSNFYIQK